jgi:hypothetical protein
MAVGSDVICSHCGSEQSWASSTLSLQLDDGRLICLRHPGEQFDCERNGLTLGQASDRGRLFRETFYVCRTCGKMAETIRSTVCNDWEISTFSVRGAMKWGWGFGAIVVPLLAWLRWWEAEAVIGGTLVALPAIYWWENRKISRKLATRSLPWSDAPGQVSVAPPVSGCISGTIVGQVLSNAAGQIRATGPCCQMPDWIEAFRVRDEDCVPCYQCGKGTMRVTKAWIS